MSKFTESPLDTKMHEAKESKKTESKEKKTGKEDVCPTCKRKM